MSTLAPLDGPPSVAVIIPTYNGARYLPEQIPALSGQRPPPAAIVVVDSSSRDGSATIARDLGCIVEVIPQAEFNHGGTRNRAAGLAPGGSDIFVFLTQDAMPADAGSIAALVAPLADGRAAASYARQLPYPDAVPPEVFARQFNYPPEPAIRRLAEAERLGLKGFFFSNVASAVRADVFRSLGGFPSDVIMNEDMVLCARVMKAGHAVAYCADAVVRHSHNYTLKQQFRRYFDIGAFLAGTGEVGGKAGGEGLRFVRGQLAWCWRNHARSWIPRCVAEAGLKFLGMHLGKRHRLLPRWIKRRCSMHAFHWR